jgi:hypothetical protein
VASIDKRKGAWRVQVRRGRRSWNKTFRMKADGEAWARDIESAADRGVDPLASRITTKDSFASLINRHMGDLATYGKPLRRSKEAVLRCYPTLDHPGAEFSTRFAPGGLDAPVA